MYLVQIERKRAIMKNELLYKHVQRGAFKSIGVQTFRNIAGMGEN